MPIYSVVGKEEHQDTYYVDGEIPVQEYFYPHIVVEAATPSKAKAQLFKKYDLDFTTPVSVRVVKSCPTCNNEGFVGDDPCPDCLGNSTAMLYVEKVK